MMANMACSLIKHKRINTTVAKAKALRTYIEPLITKSKDDSTHSRRVVFKYLQDKNAVNELFREVSEKVAQRPGGYTRILKTGNRLGDNAEMCFIELVDYNELMLAQKEEKDKAKKSTRRGRRRGGKKKSETTAQTQPQVEEKPAEETETKSETKQEPKAGKEAEAKTEAPETPTEETKKDETKKEETVAKKEEQKKEDKKEDKEEEKKEDDK
jgi:large subunit ribosomal protein L17